MNYKFVFLLVLLCAGVSCTKDSNSIPNYIVRLTLNTDLEDKELRIVGGYKTFTRPNIDFNPITEAIGFGGILVVHDYNDQFYAFDLSCPYEANRNVRVEMDESSFTAVCPECGTSYAVFSEGNGARISGVGTENLKKYYQVVTNGSRIHISN